MGRIPATGWLRKPSLNSRYIVKNALARVEMTKYAQQADLLLFDEPFSNIDKKTEEIIFEVFAELKQQQKTLLVISHDLGATVANYDRLLLLNHQLIAIGNQEEVLTDHNLTKAYGKNFKWLMERQNIDLHLRQLMNLKDCPPWFTKQDMYYWN